MVRDRTCRFGATTMRGRRGRLSAFSVPRSWRPLYSAARPIGQAVREDVECRCLLPQSRRTPPPPPAPPGRGSGCGRCARRTLLLNIGLAAAGDRHPGPRADDGVRAAAEPQPRAHRGRHPGHRHRVGHGERQRRVVAGHPGELRDQRGAHGRGRQAGRHRHHAVRCSRPSTRRRRRPPWPPRRRSSTTPRRRWRRRGGPDRRQEAAGRAGHHAGPAGGRRRERRVGARRRSSWTSTRSRPTPRSSNAQAASSTPTRRHAERAGQARRSRTCETCQSSPRIVDDALGRRRRDSLTTGCGDGAPPRPRPPRAASQAARSAEADALTNAQRTQRDLDAAGRPAGRHHRRAEPERNTLLNDQKAIESAEAAGDVGAEQRHVRAARGRRPTCTRRPPSRSPRPRPTSTRRRPPSTPPSAASTRPRCVAPQDGVVLSVAGKVGEVSTGGELRRARAGTRPARAVRANSSAIDGGDVVGHRLHRDRQPQPARGHRQHRRGRRLEGPARPARARSRSPPTNATATGTVTQITPQSTVTNNVVQYPVQVSLDDARRRGSGSGSTASMSITTGSEVGRAGRADVGDHDRRQPAHGRRPPRRPGRDRARRDRPRRRHHHRDRRRRVQAGDQLVLPTVATSTNNGFPRGGGGGGGG